MDKQNNQPAHWTANPKHLFSAYQKPSKPTQWTPSPDISTLQTENSKTLSAHQKSTHLVNVQQQPKHLLRATQESTKILVIKETTNFQKRRQIRLLMPCYYIYVNF